MIVTANQFRISRLLLLSALVGVSVLLSACGGGSAGDNTIARPNLVEPFEGVWDITGNWNGVAADEAYLAIHAAGTERRADVALYDFDDGGDNCYFRPIRTGEVFESADDRVFLNQTEFDSAVLTLSSNGNTMTINFRDTNDIDNDGDSDESIDYPTTRVLGLTEVDIEPICSTTT